MSPTSGSSWVCLRFISPGAPFSRQAGRNSNASVCSRGQHKPFCTWRVGPLFHTVVCRRQFTSKFTKNPSSASPYPGQVSQVASPRWAVVSLPGRFSRGTCQFRGSLFLRYLPAQSVTCPVPVAPRSGEIFFHAEN